MSLHQAVGQVRQPGVSQVHGLPCAPALRPSIAWSRHSSPAKIWWTTKSKEKSKVVTQTHQLLTGTSKKTKLLSGKLISDTNFASRHLKITSTFIAKRSHPYFLWPFSDDMELSASSVILSSSGLLDSSDILTSSFISWASTFSPSFSTLQYNTRFNDTLSMSYYTKDMYKLNGPRTLQAVLQIIRKVGLKSCWY